MTSFRIMLFAAVCTMLIAPLAPPAAAHGYRVGDIRIQHPFATPTPLGASLGAAYFVSIENRGKTVDRLLRATSTVAERIEFHTSEIDAAQVTRMRALDAIELAPGATLRMRPGAGPHLMLIGLKQPLQVGQTFRMVLDFERAGRIEVRVDVQQPRSRGAAHAH
jgi:copper(I)-binding protein